jgi:pimeloyl-ACP methyl ester carboxylesterase
MITGINDELILAARLLLATLFLIFGCRKLRDYPGTVAQMVQLGVPTPVLAAVVSILMELPVAFTVAIGAFTRFSVWGRNDPSFIAPGAEAFKRDLPDAEIHLLDAGHFALDEKNDEIASLTLAFLAKHSI